MAEDKNVKKARSFGKYIARDMAVSIYKDKCEELVENITCDYKVWEIQRKVTHSEELNTIQRLISDFTKLLELRRTGPDYGEQPKEND